MAVKLILLLSRHPAFAPSDFSANWVADAFDRNEAVGGPVRHLHNRAVEGDAPIENAPPAAFDAVDELWFEDEAALDAWLSAGGAGQAWLDKARRLLQEPPSAIAGRARLVWERDDTGRNLGPDPIKIVTLPTRASGMSAQEFVDHWIDVHSVLALKGPGTRSRLKRLENCPAALPLPDYLSRSRYDGAGAIEFESRADLAAEFASDHYRQVMAPDEPRFTDIQRSCAVMVEPISIID
ncbi:hypothetical protein HNO88_001859 [Novosphingobium chloroacetimidivorans]|uniref:EthD domain-containing protein n=1 Tax=Novosphingobium chloroacetimidivorans TaxID=1428314 RepID=A0A7W7K981_9SPHN|nr:EthD domain-containing protein [Novosphingobium chloroacetimidivorans]MBB4858536.1 hypothetical protein [Novosphingobium chloroacetimidivorans]